MGQYWMPVNLDKREFINPHKLGSGLKLWEQLANHPGVGGALIILCAAMPTPRGGGDLDMQENWHGPERKFPEHGMTPGPMPSDYPAIAKRTIGRWAGDRIALIGDYAEAGDLDPKHKADKIWGLCVDKESKFFDQNVLEADLAKDGLTLNDLYTDITADVAAVIEHELQGKFSGDGWRRWQPNET